MPRILVTPIELVRKQRPCHEVLRAAGFEIVYPPPGISLYDPDLLLAHLSGVDGMLAGMEPLNRRVLQGSRLRAIARMGVGYDAIDISTATELGIPVTITPGTNHVSVAEHTVALLLGVLRGFPARDQDVRGGRWNRRPLMRADGKTLGLVGLGRIGKAVAPRTQALGMRVIAHDPLPDLDFARDLAIELLSLDQLLAASDIVSLHLPCTAATTHLIGPRALSQMKAGAVLINTARGALVDQAALAEALSTGHLWGAGLDAFEQEPLPLSSPLLKLDNVLLSPHTAGIDEDSIAAMSRLAAECLVDLYHGRWPAGCVVNDQLRLGWQWTVCAPGT